MKILFVCSGNSCRSPMAEAIARREASARGFEDVVVSSAGTGAMDGQPASDGALLVGMEHGADLSGHRARMLTPELVADQDLVLVMGPQHLARVAQLGGAARAHLLTGYPDGGAGRPVPDPFGGDLAMYRATWGELVCEIRRVFDRLASERRARQP